MTIDITRFCSQGDVRSYLNAPYQEHGNSFATNGHIAVMMPGLISDDLAGPAENMVGRVAKMLDETKGYTQIIDIALPSEDPCKCAFCHGTGYLITESCDDCDGEGYFYRGRHEYECKECDGDGASYTSAQPGSDKAKPCETCAGSGVESRFIDLDSNGVPYKFQEKYLRIIQALPNHKLFVSDQNDRVARFEFDGGAGILMSCRQ